jgi:hypothetical protein
VKRIAFRPTAVTTAVGAAVLGAACGGEASSDAPPAPPASTSAPVSTSVEVTPSVPAPVPPSPPAEGAVVVELAPIGGGPAGEAQLSPSPGGASLVVVQVQDAEGFTPDIHPGSCLSVGDGPSYYLPRIQAGRSETVVAKAVEELLDGAHAIHLHALTGDPVACAELPAA